MSAPSSAAGASLPPLAALEGLVDLERSRAFHAGQVSLDLERMAALLAALGPLPEPAVAVHVAGSEGKTSTTLALGAAFAAAGLRSATYTSPHLRDVRERLRLDGSFPPDEALRAAVPRVLAAASGAGLRPTWFEALTAVARVLFAEQRVEAVAWETGLGGRLDATRLLPAHLCVITTISLEHTAVLGDTLAAIAREKAGIFRPGAPVVLGAAIPAPAVAVFREQAERQGCPLLVADSALVPGAARDVLAANRALALTALEELVAIGRLPGPARPAMTAAVLAHRVEGRDDDRQDVLFDGAHTVAAAAALVRRLPPGSFDWIVFAATSGRDTPAMLRSLLELATRGVVVTRVSGPRGIDPADLLSAVGTTAAARGLQAAAVEPPEAALLHARARTAAGRRILVTGSLYLVGRLLPPGRGAC